MLLFVPEESLRSVEIVDWEKEVVPRSKTFILYFSDTLLLFFLLCVIFWSSLKVSGAHFFRLAQPIRVCFLILAWSFFEIKRRAEKNMLCVLINFTRKAFEDREPNEKRKKKKSWKFES